MASQWKVGLFLLKAGRSSKHLHLLISIFLLGMGTFEFSLMVRNSLEPAFSTLT